jgi:hypothetical protein
MAEGLGFHVSDRRGVLEERDLVSSKRDAFGLLKGASSNQGQNPCGMRLGSADLFLRFRLFCLGTMPPILGAASGSFF